MIEVPSAHMTFAALRCSLEGSASAAPQGSLGYLHGGSAWVRRSHLAAHPYTTARPLPSAFQNLRSLSWSEDGRRLQRVRANARNFIWRKTGAS